VEIKKDENLVESKIQEKKTVEVIKNEPKIQEKKTVEVIKNEPKIQEKTKSEEAPQKNSLKALFANKKPIATANNTNNLKK